MVFSFAYRTENQRERELATVRRNQLPYGPLIVVLLR
jgi:hypothetical protein